MRARVLGLCLTLIACGQSGESAVPAAAPPVVATVDVSVTPASLLVGQTASATAVARDSRGGEIVGRPVVWTSTTPTVVIVDREGRLAAIAPGAGTVTASIDGVVGSAAVPVVAPVFEAIRIRDVYQESDGRLPALVRATDRSAFSATWQLLTDSVPLPGMQLVRVPQDDRARPAVNGEVAVDEAVAGTGLVRVRFDVSASWGTRSVTSAPIRVLAAPSCLAPRDSGPVIADGIPDAVIAGSALPTITLEHCRTDSGRHRYRVRAEVVSLTPGVPVTLADAEPSVDGVRARFEGLRVNAPAPARARLRFVLDGCPTRDWCAPGQLFERLSKEFEVRPPVSTVAVAVLPNRLAVGQVAMAVAELRDAGGRLVTGRAVTWRSSIPAVASVDSDGRVSAVSAGETTITASVDGVSGAAVVTVRAGVLEAIRTRDVYEESEGALPVLVRTVDGSPFSVTWRLITDSVPRPDMRLFRAPQDDRLRRSVDGAVRFDEAVWGTGIVRVAFSAPAGPDTTTALSPPVRVLAAPSCLSAPGGGTTITEGVPDQVLAGTALSPISIEHCRGDSSLYRYLVRVELQTLTAGVAATLSGAQPSLDGVRARFEGLRVSAPSRARVRLRFVVDGCPTLAWCSPGQVRERFSKAFDVIPVAGGTRE